MTDDIDALKAKASAKSDEQDEKSTTWRPEKGDELIGELIRGKIVMTARGQSTLIVVKERDTEEMYTVWCSSKMLADWILDDAPAQGSTVYIKFDGKRPTRNDPSIKYNVYEAAATEGNGEYWSKIRAAFRARQDQAGDTGTRGAPSEAAATQFGPDEAPFLVKLPNYRLGVYSHMTREDSECFGTSPIGL